MQFGSWWQISWSYITFFLHLQLNFVARNNKYLAEILLPTAILKFDDISGGNSEILSELLMQLRSPPKPKPRSVYKTDVL